jgi:hypothetical protein
MCTDSSGRNNTHDSDLELCFLYKKRSNNFYNLLARETSYKAFLFTIPSGKKYKITREDQTV